MKIAPCPHCDDPTPKLMLIPNGHEQEVWVDCQVCAMDGPIYPTPAEAIAAWNRLSRAINVLEAATAWQQAIATVNGVHAAEQALLAALKEDSHGV